jgi:benzoyl-CoA reductase/2-hydroxyglutaryl-CoA dehydratase subunit BcrC/BadD/HgdB
MGQDISNAEGKILGKPINRLKSMYALRAQLDEGYKKTVEAQKSGQPIAWAMFNEGLEAPFLNAIGMESVYPENYSSKSASTGVSSSLGDRSSAEGFPAHLCGYAKVCLGYAAEMNDLGGQIPPGSTGEGMPKPALLIGSGTTCDARFKWFQALGRFLDTPLWVIEIPEQSTNESWVTDSYEQDIKMLVKELKEFAAYLEHLLGRKMDWAAFENDVNATMEMNAVWYEINELRKARPCPMHSRDFWASTFASFFRATDPAIVKNLYSKQLEEIKYRVANKISGINRPEKYRLLYDGIPPWLNLNLLDSLAEKGWNFPYEMLYHPLKPLDLSHISDPVERLARYRHRPPQDTFDDLTPQEENLIKDEIKKKGFSSELLEGGSINKRRRTSRIPRDYQCDGALLIIPRSCRAIAAGMRTRAQDLMNMWMVPSLTIDGDMIDASLLDVEDVIRKAEAFEETMDHYKTVRKNAGLEW